MASTPKLPPFVEEYLESGAPEGTRNETLFKAALQLRDLSWGESDIYACLERRGLSDGLRPSEIRASIQSALSRSRRDPPGRPGEGGNGNGSGPRGYSGPTFRGPGLGRPGRDYKLSTSHASSRDRFDDAAKALEREYLLDEDEELPEGEIGDGTRVYLKTLFCAGEMIQLVRGDFDAEGKEVPSARGSFQATMTLEKWLAKLDEHDGDADKALFPASAPHGVYIAINPLNDFRRKRENVSAFRHALIEFDAIPAHHQWQLIQRSKIPCAAVIDSGGKSVHAVVRVDATDYEEYQQRVKLLVDHFRKYGVDSQNIDPTRLSRLPGVTRGDTGRRQRLLSLACGLESFTEWQASILYDHELPPEQPIEQLLSFKREEDPNNVIGKRWLCKGGSLIISGQSGIGKSSFLMQMALTWSIGRDFFGIAPVKPLKTLIVQAENDTGDLAEAFQDICAGMGIEAVSDEMELIKRNVIPHRDTIHTGEKFVSIMSRLIEKHRPDIVFVDPLLSFIGDDISHQAVASTFLRNMIGPVLAASGVIWVFLHHTGKPSKDGAKSWNIKDMAYSGLGSSELANWARETITLQRASDEKDIYAFALSKRGRRSGLLDPEGKPASLVFLQHAEDRILWERAEGFEPAGEGRPDGAETERKRPPRSDCGAGFIGPATRARIEEAFGVPRSASEAADIIAELFACSERQARRYLRHWTEVPGGVLNCQRKGRSVFYQAGGSGLPAPVCGTEGGAGEGGAGGDELVGGGAEGNGWDHLLTDDGDSEEDGGDQTELF